MSKKKQSVDWLTVKHFWSVSSRHKKELYLTLLVPLSTVGMSVVIPFYIGKIMGALTQPHASTTAYITALVIAGAASVMFNYISYSSFFRLQPLVMRDLQEEAFAALLRRSVGYHNNRISGKLVSDVADYPLSFNQLSNVIMIDIISFLLVVIVGIALVAVHSPLLALTLVILAAIVLGSGIWFRKRMTPSRKKRHDAGKAVTAHLSDAIVNTTTVKTFGNEQYEMQRHRALAATLEKLRTNDWQKVASDGSYRYIALLLFEIIFVLILVQEVRANPALLATGIFAFSYTITVSNRLFQVGTMMFQTEEALLLAMPITEMLQEEPEVKDIPDAKDLKIDNGAIELRDLSFHYTDSSAGQHVFEHLSLDIQPGEKIGLVGPSGGGKSTLTRLLLRFEDIQSGSIIIDGQNIAGVTQASLRRSIAYVPQEPLLFHRTIAENISYGKMDADKVAVQRAAEQAYAHDFIMELPNGYDTVVGERGVKLSGGQRQRIAIARAILKDAPILILDEATSALDSESEVVIQQALNELMKHRTTIVIAHRLSTIQRMDRIIVLNHGAIEEQGTHEELISANKLYAKLWKHQSGGFLQD